MERQGSTLSSAGGRLCDRRVCPFPVIAVASICRGGGVTASVDARPMGDLDGEIRVPLISRSRPASTLSLVRSPDDVQRVLVERKPAVRSAPRDEVLQIAANRDLGRKFLASRAP